jgi:O-methyltransferase
MQPARDLYLDLLLKSVSNLIYGAAPIDPWKDGLFGGASPGRDPSSPAHSMVGVLRLKSLRELAQAAIDQGVPGDFIETGVWRGGCCILMRGVLAANGVANRRVYVADSFDGLPPPRLQQDAGASWHTMRELAIPVEQVKRNFERYDLLDDQVCFIKGWFHETLPRLDEAVRFALIRLDGDMYESTQVALEHLYPRLSPGGFAIIDDYGAVEACRHAVTDYRDACGITSPMKQVDWTGVYWRKT